jgi:hypothetical protein
MTFSSDGLMLRSQIGAPGPYFKPDWRGGTRWHTLDGSLSRSRATSAIRPLPPPGRAVANGRNPPRQNFRSPNSLDSSVQALPGSISPLPSLDGPLNPDRGSRNRSATGLVESPGSDHPVRARLHTPSSEGYGKAEPRAAMRRGLVRGEIPLYGTRLGGTG